jgi:YVTN family beta-propeller protein
MNAAARLRVMRPLLLLAALAPFAAAQITTGTVLVADQQSATATIVDVATKTTTTIPVGNGPHETIISPDGKWGVVTIYGVAGAAGNKLAVIDLPAKKLVRTVDLGAYIRPHGASFIPGSPNLVAVTSEVTQNVVVADIAKGEVVTAIPTQHPGSHMLGVTADGTRAFTANMQWGGISEIDLEKRAFVRDLQASSTTEGIGVAPDGNTVLIGSNNTGTVSVIDTKAWKVDATLTGFGFPYRVGVSPNSAIAVVVDAKDGKIHIVDVKARKVTGEVVLDGSPRGVKIAPDNRTAFVTLAGTNTVAAVDLTDKKVLWTVPVGTAPDGVWYGPVAR